MKWNGTVCLKSGKNTIETVKSKAYLIFENSEQGPSSGGKYLQKEKTNKQLKSLIALYEEYREWSLQACE